MGVYIRVFLLVLFVTCVNCFLSRYHPYPYYPPSKRQIYGTIEDSERIGYQHGHRFGFPFFKREELIIFPSVRKLFIFCILFYSNFVLFFHWKSNFYWIFKQKNTAENSIIWRFDQSYFWLIGIYNWFALWLWLLYSWNHSWESAWRRRLLASIGYHWRRNIWSKRYSEDYIIVKLWNQFKSVHLWWQSMAKLSVPIGFGATAIICSFAS